MLDRKFSAIPSLIMHLATRRLLTSPAVICWPGAVGPVSSKAMLSHHLVNSRRPTSDGGYVNLDKNQYESRRDDECVGERRGRQEGIVMLARCQRGRAVPERDRKRTIHEKHHAYSVPHLEVSDYINGFMSSTPSSPRSIRRVCSPLAHPAHGKDTFPRAQNRLGPQSGQCWLSWCVSRRSGNSAL